MLGIALLQLLRLRVIRKSCYSYPLCSPAQAIAFCWWIIHTAKSSAAKDKGPPTTPQGYWFLSSSYVGLKSVKWIMEAQTVKKGFILKKKLNYTLRAKVAKVRQKSAVICRWLIKSHLSTAKLFMGYYYILMFIK